jgi:hypothetical protein
LLASESEITRAAIAAVRAEHRPDAAEVRTKRGTASLVAQANSQRARHEQTLSRIKQVEQERAMSLQPR